MSRGMLACSILVALCLFSCGLCLDVTSRFNFVDGAYVENLPDPIFYDTFVPVIHEFNLPQWRSSDLKIVWPSGNARNCDNSDAWDMTKSQQACPVVYHYNKLIESVLRNMTGWRNIMNFIEKPNSNINPFQAISCDEIFPHFTQFSMRSTDFEKYIAVLKKCPLSLLVFKTSQSQFMNVDTKIYEKILENFRAKIMSSIGGENLDISNPLLYTKYAVLTNSYTALQGMEILNYYIESSRWTEALSSCQVHKIPSSLISKPTLSLSLNEVIEKIITKHYKLSIPTEISSYYKLPLTDCTFTARNTFVVRILVPVRKMLNVHSLVNWKTIPFLNSSQAANSICELQNVEGIFIRDEITGLQKPTNCKPGELCLVSDVADWPILDSCTTALLTRNITNIEPACLVKCNMLTFENLPYFKRLSSDKYVIVQRTPQMSLDIFITCEGKPYQVIKPSGDNEIGVTIVTLPCNCQIVYRSHSLHSFPLCSEEEVSIRHISSLPWITIPIQSKPTQASNHLNVSNSLAFNANESDTNGQSSSSVLEYRMFCLYIQLEILWGVVVIYAILIAYLLWKVVQLKKKVN